MVERGDAERVLAADRDERLDLLLGEVLLDAADAALLLQRVRPRGAEDGAAARQDAAHGGDVQPDGVVLREVRASRPGSRRSRIPYSCTPLRTMPRMTALSPGQSPPPVSTPTRMEKSLRRDCLRGLTLIVIQVTSSWGGESIPVNCAGVDHSPSLDGGSTRVYATHSSGSTPRRDRALWHSAPARPGCGVVRLPRVFCTWFWTVRWEMTRRSAICL